MMSEESLKAMYAKAKIKGHEKIWGENSLTVGEIVFTIAGVLIFMYGGKVNIPAKYRMPLGFAVILIGEAVF